MKSAEKKNRTWAAYSDVCNMIAHIKRGDNLGDYPLQTCRFF